VYALQDTHYDVACMVDAYGNPLERYEYEAYGKPSFLGADFNPRTTSDYAMPVLYSGYLYDYETALYYVRYRYYHDTLGLWITRDPLLDFRPYYFSNISMDRDAYQNDTYIRESGYQMLSNFTANYSASFNLILFAGNNPLFWIDIFGLWPEGGGPMYPPGHPPGSDQPYPGTQKPWPGWPDRPPPDWPGPTPKPPTLPKPPEKPGHPTLFDPPKCYVDGKEYKIGDTWITKYTEKCTIYKGHLLKCGEYVFTPVPGTRECSQKYVCQGSVGKGWPGRPPTKWPIPDPGDPPSYVLNAIPEMIGPPKCGDCVAT
jgi:RHS repeat-associated protein